MTVSHSQKKNRLIISKTYLPVPFGDFPGFNSEKLRFTKRYIYNIITKQSDHYYVMAALLQVKQLCMYLELVD